MDVSNYLYETSKDESIKLAAISNEKRLSPIYCFLGGMYNEKKLDLFLKKGGKFNKVNIKDINFDEEKPVFKSENECPARQGQYSNRIIK